MWVKFEKGIVKKDKYHSAPSPLVTLRSWPDLFHNFILINGVYLHNNTDPNDIFLYIYSSNYMALCICALQIALDKK